MKKPTQQLFEPQQILSLNDISASLEHLNEEQINKLIAEILKYNSCQMPRKDAYNFSRFFNKFKTATKKEVMDLARLRYTC